MLSSIWLFLSIQMTDLHEVYMHRCIALAQLGAGFVAPNPMVGAVLVYENRIIGEGWHKQYGGPHAEVNCLQNVAEADRRLISLSTLYVSLEPCAHFGKTPPCTNLILENKIKKVVVGCRDPFEAVNGKGIEQLRKAGVEVIVPVLEEACTKLNKRFFSFHLLKRPYVLLKWAQTADGFMAAASEERLLITHSDTNRIVHQWRAEEAAILVGTATAAKDDPELNNRYWYGHHPMRMVIDRQLKLSSDLKLFKDDHPVVVFNEIKEEKVNQIHYVKLNTEKSWVSQILAYCYEHKLQSILVEGGASLLQSFLEEDIWNEIRTITNQALTIGDGLKAPEIKELTSNEFIRMGNDEIRFYHNDQSLTL